MIQHQLPHSIMEQIKDAGYQCWNQIYSPLFWILSVLINHWKLQENNKIIMEDNFSYSNIIPCSNNPPAPPPRIVTDPSSLRQQHKQTAATVEPVSRMQTDVAAAAAAVDPMLSPKLDLESCLSTPLTTKRKQASVFSSWKQKHPQQQQQHRPLLPQEPQPKTSFLRRLSSSSSSTSSGDTTTKSSPSSPSSPSILKSFSWKLKRQHSDSSLEKRHSKTRTTTAASTNSSKQPRLSFSHFKKKKNT